MKKVKTSKKARTFSVILVVLCCAVMFYFVFNIIKTKSDINRKNTELANLRSQYETQTEVNSELASTVDNKNTSEFVERYAKEQGGYASPDERVYRDVTPGSN